MSAARWAAAAAALLGALAPAGVAAQAEGARTGDGTVAVPAFRLPPSIYLSAEARAAMPVRPTDPEAQMRQLLERGLVPSIRPQIGRQMAPQINRMRALYPVTTREEVIAGVPAVRVRPAAGVRRANRNKVLLNLPGGGFVMGMAPGTGMIESIPVSALTGAEVVSITYRQAPEARYPAATEDVVRVYRDLLRTHRARDIAVFGCSAGGLLTAEAVAAFVRDGLPLPAAIGIFCASADARWAGDSRTYARPFAGLAPRARDPGYFADADLEDPGASPVLSPALLGRFPPTLLLTATRAAEMSAAANTHRELVRAGVAADLHVWDGLGHAFFYDPALPESREAYSVMARFFAGHLHLAPPAREIRSGDGGPRALARARPGVEEGGGRPTGTGGESRP